MYDFADYFGRKADFFGRNADDFRRKEDEGEMKAVVEWTGKEWSGEKKERR